MLSTSVQVIALRIVQTNLILESKASPVFGYDHGTKHRHEIRRVSTHRTSAEELLALGLRIRKLTSITHHTYPSNKRSNEDQTFCQKM